jgi:hypothetical protein
MAGRPKKSMSSLLDSMQSRNAKMRSRGRGQVAMPFLFTKIPRTASESMHGVLSENVLNYLRINQPNHARLFYANPASASLSVCHNHTPVAGLIKNRCLPVTAFESRFSFTFIRNPWTRLLSVYNLLIAWERNGKKTLLHGCRTLDDFVQLLSGSKYSLGQSASLRFYLTSPQWTWVYPGFSFVGRYESVQQDWSVVNKTLGISVELNRHSKLYVKTADMAVPAERQYSDWAAKQVGKIYEADCHLGGYSDVTSKCLLTSQEILSRAKSIWQARTTIR